MGLYPFFLKEELIDSFDDFTEDVIDYTGNKHVNLDSYKQNLSIKISHSMNIFNRIKKIFDFNYNNKKLSRLKKDEYKKIDDLFQDMFYSYRYLIFFWTDRKKFNFYEDLKSQQPPPKAVA